MWNSGGKNVLSKVGHGLFGGMEPGAAPFSLEQMIASAGLKREMMKSLGEYTAYMQPLGEEVLAGARGLDIEVGEDALRRAMRESIMPGLAQRGLATSGAGMGAEYDIESKLAQTRFERAAQRQTLLQQAVQGLAVLKALPIEIRQQLIAAILGRGPGQPQNVPGTFTQLLSAYGGGQGISSALGGAAAAGGGA